MALVSKAHSSQVSWETQHAKVSVDATIDHFLSVNREGTSISRIARLLISTGNKITVRNGIEED